VNEAAARLEGESKFICDSSAEILAAIYADDIAEAVLGSDASSSTTDKDEEAKKKLAAEIAAARAAYAACMAEKAACTDKKKANQIWKRCK
jgi:hypothetical protein